MNLTGDVLVSAGVMAYLGPFTATFRSKQLAGWVALCKDKSIPCSASPTLSGEWGLFIAVLLPGGATTTRSSWCWVLSEEMLSKAGAIAQCSPARIDNFLRSIDSTLVEGALDQPIYLPLLLILCDVEALAHRCDQRCEKTNTALRRPDEQRVSLKLFVQTD